MRHPVPGESFTHHVQVEICRLCLHELQGEGRLFCQYGCIEDGICLDDRKPEDVIVRIYERKDTLLSEKTRAEVIAESRTRARELDGVR